MADEPIASGAGVVLGQNSGAEAAAGLSDSVQVYSSDSTQYYDGGKHFNYTLVVQVPIPWASLNLNLDLLGDFVLPALGRLGVPQAISSFIGGAKAIFDAIIEDVITLLMAIPEASVTILVKVGPLIVVNIQLIAERVGVVVPIPTFQLDLPNFAIDANFNLAIPFPVPPPVIIQVPIPIPIIAMPPLLAITGGNVSVSSTTAAALQPEPLPISDRVFRPTI